MTLKEAIESGKKFYRKGTDFVYTRNMVINNNVKFSTNEILANDWEIQEATITLTKNQLWKAISDANKQAYSKSSNVFARLPDSSNIMRELVDLLFKEDDK